MGVHAVIAPKDRAVGIKPTVSKVASGAAETVPYIAVTNLARAMRELQGRGRLADRRGRARGAATSTRAKLDGPLAWVLGAEGEGMRRLTREHCDELVRIPMLGTRREPQRLGRRRHLPRRDPPPAPVGLAKAAVKVCFRSETCV